MASINGIRLRIDKAGRLVVPKHLRERLGLSPGAELEVSDQPDGVLLRPVRSTPAMIKVDGLWTHQGLPDPSLDWNRIVEDARDERIHAIAKSK